MWKFRIFMAKQPTMPLCYECGQPINDGDGSKEHIPAQSLFKGYDEIYKVNRITVDAHKACNSRYSRADTEFRDMIGIAADEKKGSLTESAVRNLLRGEFNRNRLRFDAKGNVIGVQFDGKLIDSFHIKNFKGLFMHQYGVPISSDYTLFAYWDENSTNPVIKDMINYLKQFNWKQSGHLEILGYILQPHRDGLTDIDKNGITVQNPNDEPAYLCLLEYNKQHATLVMAMKKQKIEEAKASRQS